MKTLPDNLTIVPVLRMLLCTVLKKQINSVHHNLNIIRRHCSFCWYREGNKKPMHEGARLKETLEVLCKESQLKEAVDLLPIFRQRGLRIDPTSYGNLLKACIKMKALEEGMRVHAHMIQLEFPPGIFLSNRLLDLYAKCKSLAAARQMFDKMPKRDSCSWNTMMAGYAKCGNLEDARKLFDKMPERGTVSWTAIIAGYVQNGHGREALDLFCEMQGEGVESDQVTYASVLSACVSLAALPDGKKVHTHLIRTGFQSDVYVSNALLDMYVKCAIMDNAQQVFDEMLERDGVSWNVMIAGCARYGYFTEALSFFLQMQQTGMKPTPFTFASTLSACASLSELEKGKQIHVRIIRDDFGSNIILGNALTDMYAKCGCLEDALKVFDKMPERDVVSWNALIAGNARHGQGDRALKLFSEMRRLGLKATQCTLASLLSACASLATLGMGKQIHAHNIQTGFESNVFAGSALLDMYAKCGSIDDARRVFDNILDRNSVSWTSMIIGYAQNGSGKEALQIFEQMLLVGMKPDNITFVGVLAACSHAGLVDEARYYFDSMSQYHSITPTADHYTCMIDLFGRAGLLDEVEDLIDNMPYEPDAFIWGSVLGACRIHGNIKLAKLAAERHFELEPDNAAPYVLLSNIYASNGKWEDVAEIRKMMSGKLVKKKAGCSWIEVKNSVHTFTAEDGSHPQTGEIYAMLEKLTEQMKKEGYVPDTSLVLLDVDEEQKEHLLRHHSEKLALAFGLINAAPGAPIRIVKNLRVCGDCHAAMKFISKIVGRKIVLRDAIRFHHFKEGLCSCRDYW